LPATVHGVRIAAVADLHFGRHPPGTLSPLFAAMTSAADVILVCGDLTDRGTPEEARGLAHEIVQSTTLPVVTVLGNHDFEGGRPDEVAAALRAAGLIVLDGDSHEVQGVGIAGAKGFCGGFGAHALGAWGEPIIKSFVHDAVAEALKLETGLARLRSTSRVAILHYSPVAATVEGEPLEIYPFLGSSRLEEPLTRYDVAAVFHGHAHHGQPEGRLSNGRPVFNVSWPLLRRVRPDQPFHLLTLEPNPKATADVK
jgi:Icc-related predicted phosphoesterase